MQSYGTHIMKSLELVAEKHGDPMDAIYQTLFANDPELEPLFVLDKDRSVRGSMLFHAIDCIEDHLGDNKVADNFIASSRWVHLGYGVPAEKFDLFFRAMQQTIKALLADEWTDEMAQEWSQMLSAFEAAR